MFLPRLQGLAREAEERVTRQGHMRGLLAVECTELEARLSEFHATASSQDPQLQNTIQDKEPQRDFAGNPGVLPEGDRDHAARQRDKQVCNLL